MTINKLNLEGATLALAMFCLNKDTDLLESFIELGGNEQMIEALPQAYQDEVYQAMNGLHSTLLASLEMFIPIISFGGGEYEQEEMSEASQSYVDKISERITNLEKILYV
jgi:hypothetical protein